MSVNNMIFLVGRFNDTSNLSLNITTYLLEDVKFRDKSSIIALGLWQFSPFKHTNAIFSHLSAKKSKDRGECTLSNSKSQTNKIRNVSLCPFYGAFLFNKTVGALTMAACWSSVVLGCFLHLDWIMGSGKNIFLPCKTPLWRLLSISHKVSQKTHWCFMLGMFIWGKTAVLLDFSQWGGGAAQIFWHLFISAFLVNTRSLFLPKCQ